MQDSIIKVLVVEDDPIIAEDLASLLSIKGFKIVGVAHNGVEAVDYLANKNPDFVILDIHLGPGMSGIDVSEIIHDKYNIPYIFLTSFDDEATFEAAEQFSPYGYLVKPFQDRTLVTTIKLAVANFQLSQKENQLSKEKVELTINQDLTTQEYSILCGLLDGLSYKQLAEKHFISINTIKYHTGNIYNKCDIKRRSELVSLFYSK